MVGIFRFHLRQSFKGIYRAAAEGKLLADRPELKLDQSVAFARSNEPDVGRDLPGLAHRNRHRAKPGTGFDLLNAWKRRPGRNGAAHPPDDRFAPGPIAR